MQNSQNGKKLLYDPMFAHKPDVRLENVPHAGTKKIIFVILISFFVGLSLYLSFTSLGSDKYGFEETENGYMLSSFNGKSEDTVLRISYVEDENSTEDSSKPVTSVRKFAVCCNEYLEFIFIGKDVELLEPHCFYYCKNLKGIFVDPENKSFTSADGVLYSKDMTRLILCPARHAEYTAALKLGAPEPHDETDVKAYLDASAGLLGKREDLSDKEIEERNKKICKTGGSYEIAPSVTEICDSAFSDCENLVSVSIPDGVRTIGQLAFFKCSSLEQADIPDSVEEIKSDGFSYCKSLTYIYIPESVKKIGHHAFFGCMGAENISMEAGSLDGIEAGESWLPNKDERSLKTKEVLFSQERSER